jgi:dTDP-4-dehydrorhamnose 3,5-epimerase
MVDMRPDSDTYLQYVGTELTAESRRAVYVPAMFAHGYQALTDNAEVHYTVSQFYAREYERGVRYDDPSLGIQWPHEVTGVSPKDRSWPLIGDAPPLMASL